MTDTTDITQLRIEVRTLVDNWQQDTGFRVVCDSWLRSYDADFSRAMGRRGLIGITWPTEHGGAGRPGIARLVVTEELLRAGAPVAGHWIADRQIGPSILRFGTEAAKREYLPGIAAGELIFCLGMSETESGSDLASVRTTATKIEGGWTITGRKIWTSQAHHATHAYVLARTELTEKKHEGLSEFIVDMSHPEVEVRPIHDLAGEHHFNEVTFDGVFVGDDQVLGTIGNGWAQVTGQLALERGGIERVLSTYPLLASTLGSYSTIGGETTVRMGEVLARLAALRALAVQVALDIDAGGSPVVGAATLKDMGTAFEKDVIEFARGVLDVEPDPASDGPAGLLAQAIVASPGFTIRGGTSEILKALIARGAQDLIDEARDFRSDLAAAADEVLAGAAGEPESQKQLRTTLQELGWMRVAVVEKAGGEGGSLSDLAEILEALGRASVSAPVAENITGLRALARSGQVGLDSLGRLTVATGSGAILQENGTLTGRVSHVPWGAGSEAVLVRSVDVEGNERYVLVQSSTSGVSWTAGVNLAGEQRDTLDLDGVVISESAVIVDAAVARELSLFRALQMLGALEKTVQTTIEHVSTREQFGRPLLKFQAVGAELAELSGEYVLAKVSVHEALAAAEADEADAETRIAAARVVLDRAVTLGARIAHQLHAAMGITREHGLHLSTRRLWAWRDEEGTGRNWARYLGGDLGTRNEPAVWDWITKETRQ